MLASSMLRLGIYVTALYFMTSEHLLFTFARYQKKKTDEKYLPKILQTSTSHVRGHGMFAVARLVSRTSAERRPAMFARLENLASYRENQRKISYECIWFPRGDSG